MTTDSNRRKIRRYMVLLPNYRLWTIQGLSPPSRVWMFRLSGALLTTSVPRRAPAPLPPPCSPENQREVGGGCLLGLSLTCGWSPISHMVIHTGKPASRPQPATATLQSRKLQLDSVYPVWVKGKGMYVYYMLGMNYEGTKRRPRPYPPLRSLCSRPICCLVLPRGGRREAWHW